MEIGELKFCISCGQWKSPSAFRSPDDKKCRDCMLRETADKIFDQAVEPPKKYNYFFYSATVVKDKGREIIYDNGTYVTEKDYLSVSHLIQELTRHYDNPTCVKIDFWHKIPKEEYDRYIEAFKPNNT